MQTDLIPSILSINETHLKGKGYNPNSLWLTINLASDYGSDRCYQVYLSYYYPEKLRIAAKYDSSVSKWFYSDTAADALEKLSEYVDGLPPEAELYADFFMQQVAATIEFGKEAGIPVDFINPLQDMMTRLSENAITHQPAAPF